MRSRTLTDQDIREIRMLTTQGCLCGWKPDGEQIAKAYHVSGSTVSRIRTGVVVTSDEERKER